MAISDGDDENVIIIIIIISYRNFFSYCHSLILNIHGNFRKNFTI